MALIRCRECKKKVSTSASFCTNCGSTVYNNGRNKSMAFGLAIIFPTIIIALILGAFSGPSPSQPREKSQKGHSKPIKHVALQDNNTHWVAVPRLNRRTCPSTDCGSVGWLLFREGVAVLEIQDGWVRISKPYDAACSGGRSPFVESGNSSCVASNGIIAGEISEWVSAAHLTETLPVDPAADATDPEILISGSDDFSEHRESFAKAAGTLIDKGRCSKTDFENNDGWRRSFNFKPKPIYFVYCGAWEQKNRIYLNAENGNLFQSSQ